MTLQKGGYTTREPRSGRNGGLLGPKCATGIELPAGPVAPPYPELKLEEAIERAASETSCPKFVHCQFLLLASLPTEVGFKQWVCS